MNEIDVKDLLEKGWVVTIGNSKVYKSEVNNIVIYAVEHRNGENDEYELIDGYHSAIEAMDVAVSGRY